MFHILGAMTLGWTVGEITTAITAIAGSITAVATAGITVLEFQEAVEKKVKDKEDQSVQTSKE